MNSLEWNNEDYSVNIRSLDNEHKLLVAMINDIGVSLQIDESFHSQILFERLDNLSRCFMKHFESEERFLLFNNYPGFDEHKSEHSRLLERLDKFESQFRTGNNAFDDRMLLFLKDLLIRHIILYDRKYGFYFQDKELIDHFG